VQIAEFADNRVRILTARELQSFGWGLPLSLKAGENMSRRIGPSVVLALLLVGGAALLITSCNGSSSPVGSSALPPAAAPTPAPTPAPSPTPTPSPEPAASPMPTPSPTPTPVPGPVTIEIEGMDGGRSFSPSPASVTAGQQVRWHNVDSIAHTATQNGGGFDTGSIAPGATSAPITLTTTGTIGYHCAFHPSMVGTLSVTP
jgi:plastocyanin